MEAVHDDKRHYVWEISVAIDLVSMKEERCSPLSVSLYCDILQGNALEMKFYSKARL